MYTFRMLLRMNRDHVQRSTNQLSFVIVTKFIEISTIFAYIMYRDLILQRIIYRRTLNVWSELRTATGAGSACVKGLKRHSETKHEPKSLHRNERLFIKIEVLITYQYGPLDTKYVHFAYWKFAKADIVEFNVMDANCSKADVSDSSHGNVYWDRNKRDTVHIPMYLHGRHREYDRLSTGIFRRAMWTTGTISVSYADIPLQDIPL
jgi:hypothetical protein